MPELYLFGAIILTFFFTVFWLVIAIKALADKMSGPHPEKFPIQGRSGKSGDDWKWERIDDFSGTLTVNDKEFYLYNSCNIEVEDSPLEIRIRQQEERSCEIVDILVNGHSIAAVSPYDAYLQNMQFMGYALNYAQSLKNQGLLDSEDLSTIEDVYERVRINDRLLQEGKVKQPIEAELPDYVWIG